jgi:hypothetical protein
MNINIVGLTDERINQCTFLLRDDPAVAESFKIANDIIESLSRFLVTEMSSLRKDIHYWKVLTRSGPFFTQFIQVYVRIFRELKSILSFQSNLPGTFLNQTDDIENYLVMLRLRYTDLAELLALLQEASVYLKMVYVEVVRTNLILPNHSDKKFVADMLSYCRSFAKLCTTKCLSLIQKRFNLEELSTHFLTFRNAMLSPSSDRSLSSLSQMLIRTTSYKVKSDISNDPSFGEKDSVLLQKLCNEISDVIEKISNHGDPNYPLGVTDIKTRRPTGWELYWFPNVIFAGATLVVGNQTIRMFLDGSLQALIKALISKTNTMMNEHIVGMNYVCQDLILPRSYSMIFEHCFQHKALD